MRFLANILTSEPFEGTELYNIVSDPSKLVQDIPTLIIGWETVKVMFPEASIIEWKITDGFYWTYGKYERRDRYEANIKKFQDFVLKNLIETVEYVFYDVIYEDEKRFEGFIGLLKNNCKKTVYTSNNMLYIYIDGLKKVFGLSLRDCYYIDTTYKKKIFAAIYDNPTVKYLKNNDEVSKDVRYKIKDRAYILPYLYSE